MSYNPYQAPQAANPYGTSSADAQLRVNAFITRVYMWMTAGLLVTGAVASTVARIPALLSIIYGNPIVPIALMIGSLVFVFAFVAKINSLSPAMATSLFIGYAALNGLSLSAIFLVYTGASIATAFFVTAGLFGVMSVVGYTTKRDLTGLGNILFMVLIGMILASLVNFFLRNPAIYWIITYLSVFVFVGLTAADTQKIKRMAAEHDARSNYAILAALTLYLDFLNLFLALLRIFGVVRGGDE